MARSPEHMMASHRAVDAFRGEKARREAEKEAEERLINRESSMREIEFSAEDKAAPSLDIEKRPNDWWRTGSQTEINRFNPKDKRAA